MKFSVSAAARLYGKPRKTLYRHMTLGRLAYSVEADHGRTLDMSELIRCYGEPPAPDTGQTHLTHPQMSQVDTPTDTPGKDAALLEEIRRQTEVIERMSDRIERLEETMRALPAPQAPKPANTTASESAAEDDDTQLPAEPPKSLADILARFESRQTRH